MALSIFDDKSKKPNDLTLEAVLRDNFGFWNEIKAFVKSEYPNAQEEWMYSGKNYGWGFRLKDPKRVIIYLIPIEGSFLFAIVFGEKATDEALKSSIDDSIKKMLKEAKVYSEGRGIRYEVKSKEMFEDIKTLVKIKLAH